MTIPLEIRLGGAPSRRGAGPEQSMMDRGAVLRNRSALFETTRGVVHSARPVPWFAQATGEEKQARARVPPATGLALRGPIRRRSLQAIHGLPRQRSLVGRARTRSMGTVLEVQ